MWWWNKVYQRKRREMEGKAGGKMTSGILEVDYLHPCFSPLRCSPSSAAAYCALHACRRRCDAIVERRNLLLLCTTASQLDIARWPTDRQTDRQRRVVSRGSEIELFRWLSSCRGQHRRHRRRESSVLRACRSMLLLKPLCQSPSVSRSVGCLVRSLFRKRWRLTNSDLCSLCGETQTMSHIAD